MNKKLFFLFSFVLIFVPFFSFAQESLDTRIDSIYLELDTYVTERVQKIPKISLQSKQADRIWKRIELSTQRKIRVSKNDDLLLYQSLRSKIKERKNDYLTGSTSDLIKKRQLINAINTYRKDNKLQSFSYNSKLTQMAYRHARDLSKNFPYDVDHDGTQEIISHVGSDGTRIPQRAEEVWYIYSFLGEDIAYNQFSAEQVLQDWLNSPTHYANIVTTRAKEIGIVKIGPYRVMVVGAQK